MFEVKIFYKNVDVVIDGVEDVFGGDEDGVEYEFVSI